MAGKKVVSVYGYGRFGRLWANILKEEFDVQVYSRRGLKDDEVDKGVRIVSREELFDCDAMFFCVAISAFKSVLEENKSFFKSKTTFFDTCSVKVFPVQWMSDLLPAKSSIIATHPMFGPDSYPGNEKSPIVMSDIRTKGNEFAEWTEYFSEKYMRVELMSPDEHDKKAAYSQGITHYVGRVLSELHLEPNSISTLGYDKLLEIVDQTCHDSWQLFLDLQCYNPHTSEMREELNKALHKVYASLNGQN